MRAARGDLIAWFDDDDWQHPQKLVWHVEALKNGAAYAGSASGWFVDLHRLSCAAFRAPHGLTIFNSAGFRREAVLPVAFREGVTRASDTYWMRNVAARCRNRTSIDRAICSSGCRTKATSVIRRGRNAFHILSPCYATTSDRPRGAIRMQHWSRCDFDCTLRSAPGPHASTP